MALQSIAIPNIPKKTSGMSLVEYVLPMALIAVVIAAIIPAILPLFPDYFAASNGGPAGGGGTYEAPAFGELNGPAVSSGGAVPQAPTPAELPDATELGKYDQEKALENATAGANAAATAVRNYIGNRSSAFRQPPFNQFLQAQGQQVQAAAQAQQQAAMATAVAQLAAAQAAATPAAAPGG